MSGYVTAECDGCFGVSCAATRFFLYRNHGLFGRLLSLIAWLLLAPTVVAAPPFVAGFDRFGQDRESQIGRLLLTELSCTACHADRDRALQPKRGPALDGAAVRLQPKWIRQFLMSPQQTKPGTTMPDMFADWDAVEKQKAIDALTAFLATQNRSMPTLDSTAVRPVAVRFWSKGDASRGKELYHRVGCVACHAPDAEHQPVHQPDDRKQPLLDDEELEELGLTQSAEPLRSVPHPDLPAKYNAQSLTLFLFDPLATRPSGRMPNLKLTPDEAADIAAYLFGDRADQQRPGPLQPNPELVEMGKHLFADLGCVNCHAVDGVSTVRSVISLVDLNGESTNGCLDASLRGLPHYAIDDEQRTSLRHAIRNRRQIESVELRLLQLNCYACHERGERGGVGPQRRNHFETVGHVDLGDEGRLPPGLDGVGGKLTIDWMNQIFAGKGDIRPHMTIRMPIFGESTSTLAAELAAEDGAESKTDPILDVRPSAEAGRQLLELGCVQCHPIRGEHLPGVVGVDLADIDRRLRPDWFRAFMLDPASLKNRTRMPSFFRDGKSSSSELLDGNVDQQIASMWAYLKDADKHPLPEKIGQSRAANFELIPTSRPIVLRTFMQRAGPHAIAVGFPDKVNLAFDAERVRIAQFWRGRFLDAHGTWFDRFTPLAIPLGDELIDLSDQTNHSNRSDRKFDGYRLDAEGVPTFLYRINNVHVEDCFKPTNSKAFTRNVKFSSPPNPALSTKVWFELISGTKLTRHSDTEYANERGLTVSLKSTATMERKVEKQDTFFRWLVPIEGQQETAIEVTYQW